jgi:DNA modification methylase
MLASMNITTDAVITGECEDVLPAFTAAFFHLAIIDPQFNNGMVYPSGDKDNLPREVYLAGLEKVFRAVVRVLTPDGSLWVQCGQTMQAEVKVMLQGMGLFWRNSIVWTYRFGPHQKRKFCPCWQMIHGFTVHPKHFCFNADDIRVTSERQRLGDKRANPKGRIPGDVWQEHRIHGRCKKRIKGHPCQTPEKIPGDIIAAYCPKGGVVLDPMCGTGSVGEAARLEGRRFIGIEKCAETAAKARARIAAILPFAG